MDFLSLWQKVREEFRRDEIPVPKNIVGELDMACIASISNEKNWKRLMTAEKELVRDAKICKLLERDLNEARSNFEILTKLKERVAQADQRFNATVTQVTKKRDEWWITGLNNDEYVKKLKVA